MSSEQKKRLDGALELSLNYILGRQRADGSWLDWDLPPGQSSIWTTAFVGYRLRNLPYHLRSRARESMRIASDWLLERMFPDGGWGYTEQTGSDADSTAIAILYLLSENQTVPDVSYLCLQKFQCPDGGFSTYQQSGEVGSWGAAHGDVTPTAILALLTKYGSQAESVKRGIEYIIKKRTSNGVWESFWWTSFIYSTESTLALINAIALDVDLRQTRETLLATQFKTSFERALLLASLVHLNPKLYHSTAWRLVDQLLQGQEWNGSWKSDPSLRITRRDCFEPWKPGDPDTLFADTNRLFTTSTAIDALSRMYAVLESSSSREMWRQVRTRFWR